MSVSFMKTAIDKEKDDIPDGATPDHEYIPLIIYDFFIEDRSDARRNIGLLWWISKINRLTQTTSSFNAFSIKMIKVKISYSIFSH